MSSIAIATPCEEGNANAAPGAAPNKRSVPRAAKKIPSEISVIESASNNRIEWFQRVPWKQWGVSALIAAANNGHTTIIDYLLRNGVDVDADDGGDSALSVAIEAGHEMTVGFLLLKGADVNAWDGRALQCAIGNGKTKIAEVLLLAGADPRVQNDRPIKLAVNSGIEMVKLLLNHGADPFPGIREAAEYQQSDVLDLLILAEGGSYDALRSAWGAALHEEHLDLMRSLIDDWGVDPREDDDADLGVAAGHGLDKCVEFLLGEGADVHAGDDRALVAAASGGHLTTVQLLINRGADAHAQNGAALRLARERDAWGGPRSGPGKTVVFLESLARRA